MDWIRELFTGESVAHTVLLLSLVAVTGLALGSIRIKGVSLGIACVLFAGLVFGHFGMKLSHETLDFVREFGLILFVYTLGLQVGPGFFGSLRKQGLVLNSLALAVVVLGAITTLVVAKLGNIPIPIAAGMFSGATTNTPSLAAAQQALKDLVSVSASEQPGLGYAVTYPFGVLGIILTMLGSRFLMKEQVAAEAKEKTDVPPLRTANLEILNPNINGLTLSQVPVASDGRVVVSRVRHDNHVEVARPETQLETGDVLLAVGPPEQLDRLRTVVGRESTSDLREEAPEIATQWAFVTRKNVIGKTLGELDFTHRYGANVTRLTRAGIEVAAQPDMRLQWGDAVLIVGDKSTLKTAIGELGNAVHHLQHPTFVPVFIGLALGVVLGSWPMSVPGVPVPIKLGLAGGPLIVAILLSSIGRIGPLMWYLPPSSNLALREFGIVLFLACVGLKSGGSFVATLTTGGGFSWMAWATLITLIPLIIVALIGVLAFRLRYATLCGLLAGSTTDPPALAFAQGSTKSDAPTLSYATVYPMVMIARIIAAQIIVIFFAR
jgi:putative transport protein